MLLFNRHGIKVFAEKLPDDTPRRGPERLSAERAAVRRLLREAFPDTPAVTIGHTESGAPFLMYPAPDGSGNPASAPEPLPAISVSHCRRMAAIAIAPHDTRLGIDCETADRLHTLRRVAGRFLSGEQMEKWANPPAALHAWCIKEAIYKAAGQPGLPLPEIPLPPGIPATEGSVRTAVSLAGREYNIIGIETLSRQVAMILVFSGSSFGN